MKRHDDVCGAGTARKTVGRSTRSAKHHGQRHVVMDRVKNFVVVWIAVLFATLSSGCSQATPSAESYEIVHSAKKGAVEIHLKVNHRKITTSQRVEARLEVLAPANCAIHLPSADVLRPETLSSDTGRADEHKIQQPADSWEETLQDARQFTLVDFVVSDDATLRNGQVRHVETFLFEPFLPGDYIIPPLTVSWSLRPSGPTGVTELTTKEISIQVVSLLPPGDQLPDIKDIAPLAEFSRTPWGWIIAGLMLGLVVLPSGVWIAVRRQRPPAAQLQTAVPMAHEIALKELEQLLAERLIEQGAVDPFYTRLSAILRYYLARRFGFRAPVQTSEEFLSIIGRRSHFAVRYRETLGRFFTHCDLVKFARARPENYTIETAVHSCRQFIEQTKCQSETTSATTDVPGSGMS